MAAALSCPFLQFTETSGAQQCALPTNHISSCDFIKLHIFFKSKTNKKLLPLQHLLSYTPVSSKAMFSQLWSLSELFEEHGKNTGAEALSHIHRGACQHLRSSARKQNSSHFRVSMNHPGIWFSRSTRGLRFWISNRLSGGVGALGPWSAL